MSTTYEHVIFDLDGTLVDSASEIHAAAAMVCERQGCAVPSLEYIRRQTGSHPSNFFLDHGAPRGLVELLVDRFRQQLRQDAGDPACVIDSAQDLLAQLTSRSVRVSLATTKPTELATLLLQRYGLRSFFSHVQGTDPPLQHKPHPDILHACLSRAPGRRALMVGDTIYDVEAATNAGIDSVGVCSGTHSAELLRSKNPTHLINRLGDLAEVLELP